MHAPTHKHTHPHMPRHAPTCPTAHTRGGFPGGNFSRVGTTDRGVGMLTTPLTPRTASNTVEGRLGRMLTDSRVPHFSEKHRWAWRRVEPEGRGAVARMVYKGGGGAVTGASSDADAAAADAGAPRLAWHRTSRPQGAAPRSTTYAKTYDGVQ